MKLSVFMAICVMGVAVGDVLILNGEEPNRPPNCARVCTGTTGKDLVNKFFRLSIIIISLNYAHQSIKYYFNK